MSWIELPPGITRPELLQLAAAADADPRTVARVLRGEHVRGRAGERIREALTTRQRQEPADGGRAA
jgi:hypothetical protein